MSAYRPDDPGGMPEANCTEPGPAAARPGGARRRAVAAAVVAVLLAHYAILVASVRGKSTTFDETIHIAAGVSYWRFGDFRLQPENGNLPQRWAALPVAFSPRFAYPLLGQKAWRISDPWPISDQFFFLLGNDHRAILLRSRATMAAASVALCLVVFLWSRSIFGAAGGMISLLLCAFSPLVIAHGPLATSDTFAALFFTLCTWSWWLLLHRVTPSRLAACGASLSGLALSKSSGLLIVPIAALTAAVALRRCPEIEVFLGARRRWRVKAAPRRALTVVVAALLCAAVAWAAVWTAYGWRHAPYPPGKEATFEKYLGPSPEVPFGTVEELAPHAGRAGGVLAAANRRRLLPEPILYGTIYVLAALKRPAFLNGEYSIGGWWYFFPYCFLVKSTLPMLALFAASLLALAALPRRPRDGPAPAGPRQGAAAAYASAPLLILFGVYWAALLTTSINIGARHMLPSYAAVFVLCGVLALPPARGWARWGVALLLAWHVGEGLRAYPHYIAYFNQVTGRERAYRHLVDSNLDWGQDLPGLKAWLDRRLAAGPPARVVLSYFGSGDAEAEGIAYEPFDFKERVGRGLDPLPDADAVYCVSATDLSAAYMPVAGRWTPRLEQEYADLRRRVAELDGLGDEGFAQWKREHPQEFFDLRRAYLDHGTARLMAFLRRREPDASVGYSILIFELTREEVARALSGPPPES